MYFLIVIKEHLCLFIIKSRCPIKKRLQQLFHHDYIRLLHPLQLLPLQNNHNKENLFHVGILGLFRAIIWPEQIHNTLTQQLLHPLVYILSHEDDIFVNGLELVTLALLVIYAVELLYHPVCVELFVVECSGTTVEKVVLVVYFNLVTEQLTGLIWKVSLVVVLIEFEGCAAQYLKEEFQHNYQLLLHHVLVLSDNRLLLFLRYGPCVNLQHHLVQVVIEIGTSAHLDHKVLHNLDEPV